jgi:hypothetical protein
VVEDAEEEEEEEEEEASSGTTTAGRAAGPSGTGGTRIGAIRTGYVFVMLLVCVNIVHDSFHA